MLKGRHILVVDDSASARSALRDLLEWEGATVDLAEDPFEAVALIKKRVPDAVALDLEMPKMSGLVFLQKLMAQHPMPVVVVSGAAGPGSEAALKALEAGALEVVAKVSVQEGQDFDLWRKQIIDALDRALHLGLRMVAPRPRVRPAVAAPRAEVPPLRLSSTLIAIGASTGGTRALADFLARMRADSPGLVIVQHMPPAFTGPFAQHLDTIGPMRVKEAESGDPICTGQVLVAPGGRHLIVVKRAVGFSVEVRDGPTVNRHRPSVDVLFKSVAESAGPRAVGVILTGMGDDGAKCMLELHRAGAVTFAQDEASCVVFGMPKEAIRLGGIDHVLPLLKLPEAVHQAALGHKLVSRS